MSSGLMIRCHTYIPAYRINRIMMIICYVLIYLLQNVLLVPTGLNVKKSVNVTKTLHVIQSQVTVYVTLDGEERNATEKVRWFLRYNTRNVILSTQDLIFTLVHCLGSVFFLIVKICYGCDLKTDILFIFTYGLTKYCL